MQIIAAWQCISPEVIVKGFKKCCMDGTDYGMLWNGMDGVVRGECEGDEGTECEDGDSDTEC